MAGLTFNDIDRRLCLDNGINSVGVHDGTRNSIVLLRSSESEYRAVVDLAQYDDYSGGHNSSMIEHDKDVINSSDNMICL
jgi:hypothetical protein